MPYYLVRITYLSKNTARLNTAGCYDMSEESVRRDVAEPFTNQKQFILSGCVIDSRFVETLNIYEVEKGIKDILSEKNTPKGISSISYSHKVWTINDVLRAIINGKIGIDVTNEFITSILERPKEEQVGEIFKIISLIENSLRKVIRKKPCRESEISDALENLFIGAGLDKEFTREKESIPYSSKKYIPDFVFQDLGAVVEAKFCDKKGKDKEIIGQINDDILAYKTRYPNLIFVIYDMGIVRNVDTFKNGIENQESVIVKVIKH